MHPLGTNDLAQQPEKPYIPSRLADTMVVHLRSALQFFVQLRHLLRRHTSLLTHNSRRPPNLPSNRANRPTPLDSLFESRENSAAFPALSPRSRLLAGLHPLRVPSFRHQTLGIAYVLGYIVGIAPGDQVKWVGTLPDWWL